MKLEELAGEIQGFSNWTHADKIRFFAWFLHSKKGRERFGPADIRSCYDVLTSEKPRDVNSYLIGMSNRKPRVLLRDSRGYLLERRVREALEEKYGQRAATVQVDRLLHELPSKIPDVAQRVFLDEAIRCFRCKAFRSTIVMAWNLAYYHFCRYIFNDPVRLNAFNVQLSKLFPKASIFAVAKRDDFGELKEFEVLQIARSAKIIDSNLHKVFKEKLDRRNTAAHPSNVEIAPHTAEEYVIDLVTNAVLKLV